MEPPQDLLEKTLKLIHKEERILFTRKIFLALAVATSALSILFYAQMRYNQNSIKAQNEKFIVQDDSRSRFYYPTQKTVYRTTLIKFSK